MKIIIILIIKKVIQNVEWFLDLDDDNYQEAF